jgi:hypothetical protein
MGMIAKVRWTCGSYGGPTGRSERCKERASAWEQRDDALRERDEARERERVAILSFDEERQRALREGKRVLEERENCKSIVDKANELIARWDQPSWKDTAPTARFINALRIAVKAYERTK